MSHTYVKLEVPLTFYKFVRAAMVEADYGHALHVENGDECIDMHGIALVAEAQVTGVSTPSDAIRCSICCGRESDHGRDSTHVFTTECEGKVTRHWKSGVETMPRL